MTRAPTDPRLVELADRLRVRMPNSAAVDVMAIADRIGVPIRLAHLGGSLEGLFLDTPPRIVINATLATPELRVAVAHELGHALVARGRMPWVARAREEAACDRFAFELVAPARYVALSCGPESAAGAYDVPVHVALVQLQRAGALPSLIRWRDKVLCVECGSRRRRLSKLCVCAQPSCVDAAPTLADSLP
jgi:Zn-dependent peptidase ImmA (M78 family)